MVTPDAKDALVIPSYGVAEPVSNISPHVEPEFKSNPKFDPENENFTSCGILYKYIHFLSV